jgi:hypothetical protein
MHTIYPDSVQQPHVQVVQLSSCELRMGKPDSLHYQHNRGYSLKLHSSAYIYGTHQGRKRLVSSKDLNVFPLA